MLMELQGKKKTRDFLSLYTKESSFHLQDSKTLPQGFLMKTHDFLQPLETAENEKARKGPTKRTTHVLPGGIGTYSISHVSSGASTFAAVKPESNTCGPDVAYAFPVWDAAKEAGSTTGVKMSSSQSSIGSGVRRSSQVFCRCNLECILYTSRQENSNGKKFYRCPRNRTEGDCNFFIWAEEVDSSKQELLQFMRAHDEMVKRRFDNLEIILRQSLFKYFIGIVVIGLLFFAIFK